MALAALALLGQLWMGQLSTAHLARWLSAILKLFDVMREAQRCCIVCR